MIIDCFAAIFSSGFFFSFFKISIDFLTRTNWIECTSFFLLNRIDLFRVSIWSFEKYWQHKFSWMCFNRKWPSKECTLSATVHVWARMENCFDVTRQRIWKISSLLVMLVCVCVWGFRCACVWLWLWLWLFFLMSHFQQHSVHLVYLLNVIVAWLEAELRRCRRCYMYFAIITLGCRLSHCEFALVKTVRKSGEVENLCALNVFLKWHTFAVLALTTNSTYRNSPNYTILNLTSSKVLTVIHRMFMFC